MARRNSLFENIMHVTALVPWWVGVALAVLSYIGFHMLAMQDPAPVAKDVAELGSFARTKLLHTLAVFLQYIIPTASLFGALGSVIKRVRGEESPLMPSDAACPSCGARMVMRTARRGARAGRRFWGCSKYPVCKGTQELTM
jgi:hypothetical protein